MAVPSGFLTRPAKGDKAVIDGSPAIPISGNSTLLQRSISIVTAARQERTGRFSRGRDKLVSTQNSGLPEYTDQFTRLFIDGAYQRVWILNRVLERIMIRQSQRRRDEASRDSA
jgi:hypothetical protein